MDRFECSWTVRELKQLCKYEHIPCTGNKETLCRRLHSHLKGLHGSQAASKKGVYAPEKYLKGLRGKEREKRLQEIRRGSKTRSNDHKAYRPFITDYDKGKLRKTKSSSYTVAFRKAFPNITSLKDKARVTGVPEDILKRVYNKGLAAWRTGHRPGATQGRWASARVNSFLMKGCTFYYPDHKLVEEAKRRSTRARSHWASMTKLCKK